MTAGIIRTHGTAFAGSFISGYQPLVLKIAATGKFTADTVDSTTGAITDGGYAKTVKVVESFGSIVILGAQANDTFAAVVDLASFNQGDGQGGNAGATTGFGALIASLVATLGGVAGDYTITSATTLNGDGTFTFA